MKGDALGVFADADQAKAQLGLAGIARGVEFDQRATDPPGEPGAADRVSKRAPNHITGDTEAAIADCEHDLRRQHPEHSDEAEQQQRRLQQADSEIGREIDEMSGILVHTLVGIGPDLAGVGQEIGPLRCQPAV